MPANTIRTHRSLDKDAPVSRPVQPAGSIKSPPILGGVHHHYVRVSVFGTHNFNDLLVAALRSAAKRIVERNPNSPGWPVMERSIMGPYSKIWVYGDSKPFLDAPQGEFAPRRWQNGPTPFGYAHRCRNMRQLT